MKTLTALTALTASAWLCAGCLSTATPALNVNRTSQVLGPTATAAPKTATPSCSAYHWVQSWAANPSGPSTTTSLAGESIREQIFTHAAGHEVRLHLTNRYGSEPVTFSDVTIGRQANGAAIKAGTLRDVYFGGKQSVTIKPGADAISDGVALSVQALSVLDASLYVLSASGPTTEHVVGEQTSWFTATAGDHTHDLGAGAYSLTTPPSTSGSTKAPTSAPQAIYYLDGLDVKAHDSVGTVAAFGDSITDGYVGTSRPNVANPAAFNRNGRWPDDLARRLHSAGLPFSVVDDGIVGNELSRKLDAYLPKSGGLSRFGADVASQSGITDVIALIGINDLSTGGVSAQGLIRNDESLIAEAHHAGLHIYLGTLTPDDGAIYPGYGSATDASRATVNRWIRGQHLADGVIDFDKAVRDPALPGRLNPKYDDGDHVHFTLAGYQALANAVPRKILSVARCKKS